MSFLFTNLVIAQEVKIGAVENKIEIGDLAGNRDLAFGVTNVLEEVIQDAGYFLNPNSKQQNNNKDYKIHLPEESKPLPESWLYRHIEWSKRYRIHPSC